MGVYWPQSYRVTESQSYRHPRVISILVGEIFLCLISINSSTRFAGRGIKSEILNLANHIQNILLHCYKVPFQPDPFVSQLYCADEIVEKKLISLRGPDQGIVQILFFPDLLSSGHLLKKVIFFVTIVVRRWGSGVV